MPIIVIHNAQTNEIVEREMNSDELAAYNQAILDNQKETEAKAQSDAAKAALLEKLGITEDEAKLLLS